MRSLKAGKACAASQKRKIAPLPRKNYAQYCFETLQHCNTLPASPLNLSDLCDEGLVRQLHARRDRRAMQINMQETFEITHDEVVELADVLAEIELDCLLV